MLPVHQCQIIGAGPAGIGMLTALYNAIATTSGDLKSRYEQMLDSLVMIEATDGPGGVLGCYQINANTNAADAVSVIKDGSPLAKMPEIEIDGKTRRVENHSKYGEVADADSGEVIPGLFACGLGMHILPDEFHGEKSINDSINGLQSYPLAITPAIIQKIIENA